MTTRMAAVALILFCAGFSRLHADSSTDVHIPTWQEIAFPLMSGLPVLFDMQAQAAATPAVAEPYAKEEFPKWMQDLWRAGVIFVGTIPFTYFFTLEGYDLYRYAASGFSASMAPWPFQPASEISYTDNEKIGLIITALSASLLMSAADYILGLVFETPADKP